jgi:hypothetical protein
VTRQPDPVFIQPCSAASMLVRNGNGLFLQHEFRLRKTQKTRITISEKFRGFAEFRGFLLRKKSITNANAAKILNSNRRFFVIFEKNYCARK